MSRDVESFGEVSQALTGIGNQLALHVKVFTGTVAIAVLVTGFVYSKLDDVEERVAKVETKLEAIEGKLDLIRGDTGAILERLDTASINPSPTSFIGYAGMTFDQISEPEIKDILSNTDSKAGWVYFPVE